MQADRADGPAAYQGMDRPWDAVIDVATDPTFVSEALDAIGPFAHHWTYVSSCSVYADQNVPYTDESAATIDPLPPGGPSTPETYGAAKAASEASCALAVGDRLLLCRPGLIGGAAAQNGTSGVPPDPSTLGVGPLGTRRNANAHQTTLCRRTRVW